jgi:hypothetical protein
MHQPIRVPDDDQFQPSPADLEELAEYGRQRQLEQPLPVPEVAAPAQIRRLCDRCGAEMWRLGKEWICPDCVRFFPAALANPPAAA